MENLADQLKNVKLKKSSGPVRDYSSPKTAGFMQEKDVQEYQSSVLDVNTEEWIDLLRDDTFASDSVPITVEEAKMFVKIYERLFANKDPQSISEIDWREKVSESELTVVSAICDKLQPTMDKFKNEKRPYVFVKMSSRSPKDAPMAQKRFKDLYLESLQAETKESRMQENTQIFCLLKAAFNSLKVSNAHEIMDMCIRSERIYQDFLLALSIPERFRANWIVREFVDIDIDMEFRGFVYEGRLTALSQYNYLVHSDRLVAKKQEIVGVLDNFFKEHVKAKLENFVENYIIDFAVCEDGAKLWVIEINPFLTTTDAALFSWEHEMALLQGSESDLQFRVTEKARPGAKAMLPVGMKDLIKEVVVL